jgi:hypothetical protein
LLFPGIGPNDSHLRNLGGGIELKFIFTLGMKNAAVGAAYYRVSICEADASGNPTGSRYYYRDGLAWEKIVGADIVPESLGPWRSAARPISIASLQRRALGRLGAPPRVDQYLGTAFNVPADTPANLALPAVNHLVTLGVRRCGARSTIGTPASGQPESSGQAFKYRAGSSPPAAPATTRSRCRSPR